MTNEGSLRGDNVKDYDVYGPEDASPVVLIHGSTVSRQSWILQIRTLQHSARVIAIDLPGHGVLAGQPFRLDAAVQRLYEIVRSQAGGRALIVGVSLGGHVATLFAASYPQMVAGLIVSGASGNMGGAVGLWMRLVGSLIPRLVSEEKLKKGLENSLRKKWPADVAEAQIAAGVFPLGAMQSFIEIPKYHYLELIRRVQAPVLVLNGELDMPNRRGEQRFADAAPDGRVSMLPGAGHACNIEAADAYNRQVLSFAREIGWIRSQRDAQADIAPAASKTAA